MCNVGVRERSVQRIDSLHTKPLLHDRRTVLALKLRWINSQNNIGDNFNLRPILAECRFIDERETVRWRLKKLRERRSDEYYS